MADRDRLARELAQLDAALKAASLRLSEAAARQRYLAPSEAEAANTDKQRLVREMDRIMTRIRAVEAKLAILNRGGKLPFR
jgi:hypothetical protein